MSTSTLYRTAAVAGLGCALLLVINAARFAELVPENALTHAIAPLAALAGLFVLTGLYLWQHAAAGRLGLLGYALNAVGLAGVFAIEYTVHFTFAHLNDSVVEDLVEGATGTAFTMTSVVFILGVLGFATASWRVRQLPTVAIGLYAVGLTLVGLRTLLPEAVYLTALAIAAVGIGWLSVALYQAASSYRRAEARTL